MKLSSVVKINYRAARSVNLERDQNDIDRLKNYQLTQQGTKIIKRFVESLEGEPVNAWSLTGLYGMGKSSFANFLLNLCKPKNDINHITAVNQLKKKDGYLAIKYVEVLAAFGSNAPLFPIFVTAKYESLNSALLSGLSQALDLEIKHPQFKEIQNQIDSSLHTGKVKSTEVLTVYKRVQNIIEKPIVLIIDEFGKILEYQSHRPKEGDIFAIQLLAESHNTYIWLCLHQSFDEYAMTLSNKLRNV
ncbi:MAG: hypothetical protein JXB49_10915 [Bacteroidales bacterium]|nr:hypothetical protein [Bacteroidales bacterium]